METITITKNAVRNRLYAETTNVSRTFKRNDGVSDHEDIVVDQQIQDSLVGAWREATSKLSEKMHEFLNNSTVDDNSAAYTFKATSTPSGLGDNILMYIVDFIVQDWLASVRPDYRQRYIDRCVAQMDDLLRKLYKKEPPV